MKKKIMSLIIAFIFLISLFANTSLACTEEDGWTDCTPEQNFAREPTPENFNTLSNPTADDLAKVKNPTVDNFDKLGIEDKTTYLTKEGKYSNDFAESFFKDPEVDVEKNLDIADKFFTKEGNLIKAPTAANTYLREKFGNSDVTFNLVEGMKFTDNPPKIAVGDVELTLREGTEPGTIPIGTTSVGFDSSENKFVFDPREITITGDKMVLQEDGSIRFETDGEITD